MRFIRLLAAAAIILAAPGFASSGDVDPAARKAWGFDRSDLQPHPGVRFGVLRNGMRYALMRNSEPAGGLAVRLHVDAGSSVEGPGERGFMHLIEHLLFHGSENLPAGALPLMLHHQGLKRWSDFNAFTSYDETVYRLDLGKSDARARETAMTVMEEILANLSFGRDTVRNAKADVRAEIASRDAVQDRIAEAQHAFFFPGTPLTQGAVAGTDKSVARASPAALRRLYDAYYRLERITLVIVGDFEPAAAEAEVERRFSPWTKRGPPGAVPAPPALREHDRLGARLFVDPAAPSSATIARVRPLGGGDAAAPRDRQYLEHLGCEMLNRRLSRAASAPGNTIASADCAAYDHFSTARLTRISVDAKDGDWRGALQQAAGELDQALTLGFTAEELAIQRAESGKALAARAAPSTSPALADAIVDAVARDIVFTAPADPAGSRAYLDAVRLDAVNAAFRSAWEGGRLLFVTHSKPVPGGEAAVLQAYEQRR